MASNTGESLAKLTELVMPLCRSVVGTVAQFLDDLYKQLGDQVADALKQFTSRSK